MRQIKLAILLTVLLSAVGARALAYDAKIDGIYYNYINDRKELEVTYYMYSEYSGNVVIPERVFYQGRTLKVTSIGNSAFNNCSGLTSVTIPNSVTSIGNYAFAYCM